MARTADEKGSIMTDQNLPPEQPGDATPPAAPEFTAPAAPAAPAAPEYTAPAAPAYTARSAPAAPAYGAPAYGAPANAYGQPGGAAPKTNTFAIVSLVSSLAGLITGITFLVGIIFGHLSLSQIKKTGENGRGMALAGLIIGYVGLLLGIILTILIIVLAVAAAQAGYSSY